GRVPRKGRYHPAPVSRSFAALQGHAAGHARHPKELRADGQAAPRGSLEIELEGDSFIARQEPDGTAPFEEPVRFTNGEGARFFRRRENFAQMRGFIRGDEYDTAPRYLAGRADSPHH